MKIPPVKVYFSEEDKKEVLRRIEECLSTGMVSQGKNVKEFEAEFSKYIGCKHAVAVNSGGSALEIGMRILDVRDKEVLIPTNTFIATASSVLLAGGRIKFVDIAPDTFSLSLENLKRVVTRDTVGVIVVHIGGLITPEIEAIRNWCNEKGLWLFEDAAHAHGSSLNGKFAGTFGKAGAYSFFATKVMTSAEGGMIVTDDEAFAKKATVLRDYGKPEPWVSYHTDIGANWRMSDIAGALGIVQLRRLDDFISWREKIARIYTDSLKNVSGLSSVLPRERSSWYKYIVLLPNGVDREKLKLSMKERDISLSGGVYDIPLHRQPVFSNMGGQFPVAEDVCGRHICLPLYYGMTEDEGRYVVETLKEIIGKGEDRK